MLNERLTTRMHRADRRGFTLLELAISLAIISVLLVVGSLTFNSARRSGSVAQARNAVLSYAAIARSYAIANQIETMLVINPYNGRFEIWHLNPPANGGVWDPLSSGTTPGTTDGYAFAPVLDSDARLPVDSSGNPIAYVNPIDYQERSRLVTRQDYDNLIWTALCFDESGVLVTRSRRIATQTDIDLGGIPTGVPYPNRIRSINDTSINQTYAPDMSLLDPGLNAGALMLVSGNDSLITSTRGFVVSDRKAMENVIGKTFNVIDLAGDPLMTPTPVWLFNTRHNREYRKFAEEVLLDRYSGEAMIQGDE